MYNDQELKSLDADPVSIQIGYPFIYVTYTYITYKYVSK